MERAIEKQKDLYLYFVDFEKCFDTLRHGVLTNTLRKYGMDREDVRMLAQLYRHHRAVVRVGDDASEWVNIERGVR